MTRAPAFLGLLLLAGAPTGQAAMSDLVDIRLLASATVPQADTLLLGDVATIRGTDLGRVRAFAHFPLPAFARSERGRRIPRGELERMLGRRDSMRGVRWFGAEAVTLHPAGVEVSGMALEQVGRMGLLALLARHGRFRLEAINPALPVVVPPGQLSLQVRPVAVDPSRSSQSVSVDVAVDGRAIHARTMTFLSQRLPGAVVPGVESVRTDPPQPGGRAAGLPEVSSRRAIARGDKVAVRAQSGVLQVEGSAEALGDGAAGQQVELRTPAGARLRGLVVGPGQVEVAP